MDSAASPLLKGKGHFSGRKRSASGKTARSTRKKAEEKRKSFLPPASSQFRTPKGSPCSPAAGLFDNEGQERPAHARNTGARNRGFYGRNTKEARRSCPRNLWSVALRKLDQVDSAESLDDLRIPPGNRLEALSGDRQGQHSIRINDQYRICFVWTEDEPEDVEIVDYH